MMWVWVLPLLVAVGAKPADKSVATPDIKFFTKSAARPDIKHFTKSATKQSSCSGSITLAAGDTTTLQSPIFSFSDRTCSYLARSPASTTMSLTCNIDVDHEGDQCIEEAFVFWPSFDVDQEDFLVYCGRINSLHLTTTSNVMGAQFIVKGWSFSSFFCTITVSEVQSTPASTATPDSTATPASTAAPTPAPTAASTQEPTPGECECGVKGASRIVGGEEAEANEFPWLVAFRKGETGRVFCGGSLIAENWVLTAAHCAAVMDPFVLVTVGEHVQNTVDETAYETHYGILQVISHEHYDENTVDNDVALIRLAQPVTFNNGVSPVCLPYSLAENDFQGANGTVAGWGLNAFNGEPNEVLHKVEMPIFTTEECLPFYPDAITDNMMCTYDPGQDACQGDSGGPLTAQVGERHYQVGVVSWGEGCADVGNPGVYAKVTNYLDWIRTKTSGAVCQA